MPTKIPPPSLSDKGKTITFHRFPHHIWHDQNLSLHERVVLCRVWSFENSTPPLHCYLSFEQWARELGCKRRHTIKVLNLLIEKKLLSKIGRGTQTNLWALVHTEHQQEDASAYRTLPSAYRTPVLVHTEHQTSVYSAPKKIKEDQLEDHKEDQIVADAPTPTDEFSLILAEPQDSEVLQESDSLKELTKVSEAPPIPAAPPKTTRKARKGAKVPFPSPEYWAEKRPDLVDWAKKRGALGTDEEIGRWVDERLEKLEGAAISKDMKYSSWSQTFQNFYQHLIPTQLKKAFDGLVLAANDKNRFHDIWDKAPSAKKFGFEAEGVEAYRYRLKNFDEDSRDGGTLLKHFIKTVNAK